MIAMEEEAAVKSSGTDAGEADILGCLKQELWDLYEEFLTELSDKRNEYHPEFLGAEAWLTEKVMEVRDRANEHAERDVDYFDLALVFTVVKDRAIAFKHEAAAKRLEVMQYRAAEINEKKYRLEHGNGSNL